MGDVYSNSTMKSYVIILHFIIETNNLKTVFGAISMEVKFNISPLADYLFLRVRKIKFC